MGTVFSIPVTGGTPTTLFSFDGTHGNDPFAGVTLSGSTLYGTTYAGGSYNAGTVFSIPVTGGTPTVLFSFDGTHGSSPYGGSLILSGSTLYGTTWGGGSNNDGTVFGVPLTGGTPTVLYPFDGTYTSHPISGLTLSGSTLYGTTASGGGYGYGGTVFSMPVAGGTPTTLFSFDGTDGDVPVGTMTLTGSTLYGTAVYGGATWGSGPNDDGYGTVFALTVPEPSVLALLGAGHRPVGFRLVERRQVECRQ